MTISHAEVPAVGVIFDEIAEGKTITGSGTVTVPENLGNVIDRDANTASLLPTGFAAETHTWRWHIDLGSAHTVNRMRVWDPIGGDYFYDPPSVIVMWSNDGVNYTIADTTYSDAEVPNGLDPPLATTTTEYRYDLDTPSSHRYWLIRQEAPAGLNSGRGMAEWFVDAAVVDPEGAVWNLAPDTIDVSDSTYDDVTAEAIVATGGPLWRGDLGDTRDIEEIIASLGMDDAGEVQVAVQAGDLADFSDAATLFVITVDATGGLAADDFSTRFDAQSYRYWQLSLVTTEQDVRVYEVGLTIAAEQPELEPGRAILEIYVHDEDASRWGVATWATGPATGTEGIWSAAGWQDVTPQGVNAHIIWGSRAPERGILSEQNAGSWNVETYDPDRILDPGNFDSPYYPQLVAGVPIRISHDSLVIRTGYIDRLAYKHKPPNYRGQLLCTDTWALLNQAMVPADSILGNTLLERISDAINAAGIAVGGIPIPPAGPTGPTIADWVEGAALDDPTSVKAHIDRAAQEALWVVYVKNDAGLGLRSWGEPLDRGREITAENLEDLESSSSEEGLYSVARVQVEDPDLDPIEREAAPLPRYGRRMIERTEPTVDPEGWADAVLSDRSWPGVGYIPGTIHCFTADDVDYFGSLEIMERVTITVPGAVSVQGRVLGGELWVEHRKGATKGATWQFQFAVATDGATAIGLTTLVSSQSGEPLVDSMTETDYLEAS